MSKDKEFYTPYWMQYSDITGDNNSALMLAQLEYWQGIKKNGWVVKSATDWWNELRLTSKQVKRIKAELEALGYIETELVYWGNSNTTGYKFKKDAVQKALSDGFNAYKNKPTQPKGTDTLGTSTKGTSTKGTDTLGTTLQVPKGLVYDTKRDHSITDITTENTTEITSFTETSSVVPKLMTFDFMQDALEAGIEKNSAAKPKSKKPKAETDPLTAEIHKYTLEAHDYFKAWYEDRYQTALITWDKDFVNIKRTFKKLITASANLEESKRLTPERCFLGVKYIVQNFDKLHSSKQNNFSLNYIATNWNALISSIKNYQAPVERKNFNEPVPYVHKKLPQYYDGYALPLGITSMQFEKLAELVMRERIMEGLIDENLRLSGFCQMYRIELHKITEEQLTQLMKDYEII